MLKLIFNENGADVVVFTDKLGNVVENSTGKPIIQ
jgi:hypothetical protein